MSVFAGNLIYAAEEPGRIVKSWVTIPTVGPVTVEADVLSNSWDPPALGCYLVSASIPFDGSASGTDVKMRLYVGGVEIDYKIEQTPGGVFVGKIRCLETVDITSLTTVTVKSTAERISGAATVNVRIVAARIEIFHVGNTGIRA